MPYYYSIKERSEEGKRTLEGLKRLRAQLDEDIPKRDLNDSFLLATWNIREFDSSAYGLRSKEALQYIAEIISRFDLVAVQEVRSDLDAVDKLRNILGSWWETIVSDVTEGTAGNSERMLYLYDSRKVRFGHLAGELVLPPITTAGGESVPARQVARTPFMCGFSCSWIRFIITTVHIIYGKDTADNPERVDEIRQIGSFLKKRADSSSAWSQNMILLGDFNIYRPEDQTMDAITSNGFVVPEQLQSLPSNAMKNKHYDQIAFRSRKRFATTGEAGVFDYFRSVYREEDQAQYASSMGEAYNVTSKGDPRSDASKARYYKTYWRTHQMSDHLPMWLQLRCNFSEEYLKEKRKNAGLEV
jgi:endonuclease/exonuclease/phosphatase family metal-dependent hydrolase